MSSIHQSMTRSGLVRPLDDRVLGGVCAGIGRRFGIDPWPARLLFILVLMLLPGSQILIYPVLWILMPSEERYPAPAPYAYPYQAQAQAQYAQQPGQNSPNEPTA